ncbi:MAG: hypothetical protein KJ620_00660 [Candidatus Edwardsbacteria bacterium]|nr:hypothetical protein [Candidatus Edwardsbacteria bacterium]MBU1576140.1 hypothetical protein [Candidatus Edwardsbacteria bacterium]MBU2464228.1 hypothetical protein [Candidatus Edwardsbacteria bacterium]MBU2593180.1 hypothetical protein [Candidatus Edwardsbacteria bacterium]
MTTDKSQTYDVLKIPDFRKFLFGRFFVTISIQMTAVIVGWQIYQITKDPMALGLVPSLLFNSGMTLAVAAAGAKLAPKLREHMEKTE